MYLGNGTNKFLKVMVSGWIGPISWIPDAHEPNRKKMNYGTWKMYEMPIRINFKPTDITSDL